MMESRAVHINSSYSCINWAGGLYGIILTKAVSTDQMQWVLYKTEVKILPYRLTKLDAGLDWKI